MSDWVTTEQCRITAGNEEAIPGSELRCGTGVHTWSRSVEAQAQHGGVPCDTMETEEERPCEVPCEREGRRVVYRPATMTSSQLFYKGVPNHASWIFVFLD